MLWWSPDAQFVAFAVANDSTLPLYKFPYYEPTTSSADDWNAANGSQPPRDTHLYDASISVRYPKAGDAPSDPPAGSATRRSRAVPFVSVHIHLLASAATDKPVAIIEPPTSEKLRFPLRSISKFINDIDQQCCPLLRADRAHIW